VPTMPFYAQTEAGLWHRTLLAQSKPVPPYLMAEVPPNEYNGRDGWFTTA